MGRTGVRWVIKVKYVFEVEETKEEFLLGLRDSPADQEAQQDRISSLL